MKQVRRAMSAYWQLAEDCWTFRSRLMAPTLVPVKAGDAGKETDRRDAEKRHVAIAREI